MAASRRPPATPQALSGFGATKISQPPAFAAMAGPHMSRPPMQVRRYTLAFPKTTLAPGVKTRLTVRPQMPFRPERLVIPDEYSDAEIHEIMVGNRQQLVSSNTLPASLFGPTQIGVNMQFDTANVAQDITIVVSRPKGGDFMAVFMGAGAGDGGDFIGTPVSDLEAEPLVQEAEKAIKEEDERYEPGITLEELEAREKR